MEDLLIWEEKFEECVYGKRLLDKIISLNSQVASPVDVREVKKAIYYARKYHGRQMRQSGEPYYSHPIEVAYMLAEFTALEVPRLYKPYMLQVALLHDTVEDTDLTESLIVKIFNQQVASGVEGLTRIKPYGKISAEESLNLLIRQKKHDIALVKLFDRIHNVQTLSAKSPEKAEKIIKESLNVFVAISIYLETPALAKKLTLLCYKYLSLPVNQLKPFIEDNCQLFFPIFQNEINLLRSQLPLKPK